MYKSFCRILAACAVAGVALPTLGQTTPIVQTESCKVPTAQTQPRPYYAEFKTTRVQTLGNGATITTESTRVQAMDSQNRILFSNSQAMYYGDHSLQTWASVTDRTAGTQTTWNSQTRKATVTKEPPVDQRHGC